MRCDGLGSAIGIMKAIGDYQIVDKAGPGAILREGQTDNKYLVMFKREFYKNFKYHFDYIKKENGNSYGWGQIMNRELLFQAHRNGVNWIVFVTPNGKAYKTSTRVFIDFYKKHNTDVPHLEGEVALPLEKFERLQ